MKATYISRENDDVKFEMAFDADEFESAQIEVYKKTKGKFPINGFRAGKAPRKIIEQHYGEGVFMEDAIDDLLNGAYPKALRELGIEPVDRPKIDFSDVSKGNPFTATVTVVTIPEFELKDYEGVTIKDVTYDITDQDVDDQITGAQKSRARLIDKDCAAEDGDTVNIDYLGTKDGVAFDGGAAEGHNLKLGSGSFIPGFEEQLIGTKAGDETEVKVTFPEEYHSEDLAGAEAVFAVKVNGVKAEELPEIDDEFASEISEFETLEELKADVKKNLEKQSELRAESEKKDAVLEAVYEANEIKVPEVMIETEKDAMVNEFASNLSRQGLELEQYLMYMGKDMKSFRDEQDAEKRVKMRLIIKAAAKAQGFEATADEVSEELTKMAEMYGMEKDKLTEVLGEDQIELIEEDIKNRKAVDYMYESAIVEAASSKADAAEEPTKAES